MKNSSSGYSGSKGVNPGIMAPSVPSNDKPGAKVTPRKGESINWK